MFWGRPHELVILGDVGGMMVPARIEPTGLPPDPERRTFRLSGTAWRECRAIAESHGWRPAGTVRCDTWTGHHPRDASYEPHSDWCR